MSKPTQYKINVMQAFLAGKKIQSRAPGSESPHLRKWGDVNYEPTWNWTEHEYRIKPEPAREIRVVMIGEEYKRRATREEILCLGEEIVLFREVKKDE